VHRTDATLDVKEREISVERYTEHTVHRIDATL